MKNPFESSFPPRLYIAEINGKNDVLTALKMCWLDISDGFWEGLPAETPEWKYFRCLFNEAHNKKWFKKSKMTRFLNAWKHFKQHSDSQSWSDFCKAGNELFGIKNP